MGVFNVQGIVRLSLNFGEMLFHTPWLERFQRDIGKVLKGQYQNAGGSQEGEGNPCHIRILP